MHNFYDWIAKWIATQLDALKIKNPVVYVFVQSNIGTLLTLFATDKINIPTLAFLEQWAPWLNPDTLIIGVLASVMGLLGARTTAIMNEKI